MAPPNCLCVCILQEVEVIREVPVPVEKIVEKVVTKEVPVERTVFKELDHELYVERQKYEELQEENRRLRQMLEVRSFSALSTETARKRRTFKKAGGWGNGKRASKRDRQDQCRVIPVLTADSMVLCLQLITASMFTF